MGVYRGFLFAFYRVYIVLLYRYYTDTMIEGFGKYSTSEPHPMNKILTKIYRYLSTIGRCLVIV